MSRRGAVLLMLTLGSCGMQRTSSSVPVPGALTGHDTPANEIARLDAKIGDDRRALHLPPQPEALLVEQMHGRAIVEPPASLHAGDACSIVCDLAADICKAQDDICRLAGELGDDEWARSKCDSAKASCTEAKKRCLDCGAPSPAAAPQSFL